MGGVIKATVTSFGIWTGKKKRFFRRPGKISGRSVSGLIGLFAEAGTPATDRVKGYTRWRKFELCLVWRMVHRRTGGRGGEPSEVTDNFASLVLGDFRKPPEYGRVFSRTASKKLLRLYAEYERGVKQSNKAQAVKRHVLSMSELLQKHIRACLSTAFFYGSDLEKVKLRETLARHTQCREEDEVDPSVAAAAVKKALAP